MDYKTEIHEGILEPCGGKFESLAIPSIRWWEPSESRVLIDPKSIKSAEYLPEAFQMVRCEKCKSFFTAYFIPNKKNYKIEHKICRNLPFQPSYDWAWFDAPIKVREEYFKAHIAQEPDKFSDGLVACRRALEATINSLASSISTWRQRAPLFRKIGKLKDEGILNENLSSIADALRKISNPGAHDGRSSLPSNEIAIGFFPFEADMTVALYYLETLISHLYIIPAIENQHLNEIHWQSVIKSIRNSTCGNLL